MEQIIIITILILSIVIHEVAHGYMANWLGDPTARLQGRLSANPLVHIDPLGSVIVPALLIFGNFVTGSVPFLFGWAKPVPYNPYNLSDQKYGEAKVAAAGPAANLFLAFIFAMIIRSASLLGLSDSFVVLTSYIVYMNILLALFNLIPIPPLDGSKILTAFLPFRLERKYREFLMKIERYGFVVTLIFVFLFIQIFWLPFSQLIGLVFELFTGIKFF